MLGRILFRLRLLVVGFGLVLFVVFFLGCVLGRFGIGFGLVF